jgi:hypothetical protein
VAIGYDTNGIYVRDSSGWDNRYPTWSRAYGEVGFSGWVVALPRELRSLSTSTATQSSDSPCAERPWASSDPENVDVEKA